MTTERKPSQRERVKEKYESMVPTMQSLWEYVMRL